MGRVVIPVDRKALNVLLAVLDLEQRELAELMGYREGYVANVLNGFTKASASLPAKSYTSMGRILG
jgi:hypothetical protein